MSRGSCVSRGIPSSQKKTCDDDGGGVRGTVAVDVAVPAEIVAVGIVAAHVVDAVVVPSSYRVKWEDMTTMTKFPRMYDCGCADDYQ